MDFMLHGNRRPIYHRTLQLDDKVLCAYEEQETASNGALKQMLRINPRPHGIAPPK
jgi:hypothetical protein